MLHVCHTERYSATMFFERLGTTGRIEVSVSCPVGQVYHFADTIDIVSRTSVAQKLSGWDRVPRKSDHDVFSLVHAMHENRNCIHTTKISFEQL